jgi:SAM-dependent methyltransferase
MSEMGARYDHRARLYGRFWAPVLAPAAIRLLDAIEPAVAAFPTSHLLDAGTGSGALALAAARRWPQVRVTGLDISAGMLAVARAAAAARLAQPERARLTLVEGSVVDPKAAGLAPASIDAVISSFVLHLVPDRAAALAGLRGVLRPGGVLAFVVWAQDRPWAPEAAFDAALAGALARGGSAAPPPVGGPRSGPIASAAAARAELQEAGFVEIDAWEPALHHRFRRAAARAFFVEYDRAEELAALSPALRAEVLAAFDAALAQLPDSAFAWHARLVAARAVRPPGG